MMAADRVDRARSTLHALRQLLANPDDTPRVFEITRALGLPSLRRGALRFKSTPVGRRVLAERIDLLDTLRDRAALAELPSGTLGRAYHDSRIPRETFPPTGSFEASMAGSTPAHFDEAGLRRYAERMREQHDLWHTLTGYGRDPFGEVCLLAFTYAQTRNKGLGLIALVGTLKGAAERRHPSTQGGLDGVPCGAPRELAARAGLGTVARSPRGRRAPTTGDSAAGARLPGTNQRAPPGGGLTANPCAWASRGGARGVPLA